MSVHERYRLKEVTWGMEEKVGVLKVEREQLKRELLMVVLHWA